MVTEAGQLVWAVDHDTWGTVRRARGAIVQGNLAIASEADPLECPIRFQGQWEDGETGLYYNRFRYYEPLAGQYVSKDKIGLLGGARINSYADSPTGFVDPLGLAPHDAKWLLRDGSGAVRCEGALRSGSISPPGRRLSFQEQLQTHTEAKILDQLESIVQPGDHIEIYGTKPPCNPGSRGCQWRMTEFAKKHGATVTYIDTLENSIFCADADGNVTRGCCGRKS